MFALAVLSSACGGSSSPTPTPAAIQTTTPPTQLPTAQAQTEFRGAAIPLTGEDHPITEERPKAPSAQVAAFSRKGDGGADTTNFCEATGGRATITMDGLAASKKPVPTLSWFEGSDP